MGRSCLEPYGNSGLMPCLSIERLNYIVQWDPKCCELFFLYATTYREGRNNQVKSDAWSRIVLGLLCIISGSNQQKGCIDAVTLFVL